MASPRRRTHGIEVCLLLLLLLLPWLMASNCKHLGGNIWKGSGGRVTCSCSMSRGALCAMPRSALLLLLLLLLLPSFAGGMALGGARMKARRLSGSRWKLHSAWLWGHMRACGVCTQWMHVRVRVCE